MRTTRRKIANAEEAHRLLDELERSGEDPPTFCRKRGLDGRSLNCWRLNLGRQHGTGKRRAELGSLRIVEVGWPAASSADSRAEEARLQDEACRYRVSIGDAVIEVDGGFSEEVLYRLLSVVRAC